MGLSPLLKVVLDLGDLSVRRVSANQRWGMHREEFPLHVFLKAVAPG